MLDKAIEKIKDEIKKSDRGTKVIGDFVIQYIKNNTEDAEKVLQEGKTIEGGLKEVFKVAKTRAKSGCAMLEDPEVFEIVLKYFGIQGDISKANYTPENKSNTAEEKSETINVGFNVNLDDLL